MRNVAGDVYQLARQLGYNKIRVAGHDLGCGFSTGEWAAPSLMEVATNVESIIIENARH